MNVSRAMFPVGPAYSAIADIRNRLENLQIQLSSGQRYQSLSELGSDRIYDMTVRSRLGRIEAFQSNIQTVNLRLDIFDNSLTRLTEIQADSRAAVASGGVGPNGLNVVTAQELSHARLDEVLTIMNTDINGRHVFGGSTTDVAPVVTIDKLLNGDGAKDGLRTLVDQRKQADAGANGLGRLDTTLAADVVYLTEDGVHPFGFKLTSASTTSSPVAINQPAGSPQELSVQFLSQPSAGDTVTITVQTPDGVNHDLVMKAVTTAIGQPGEFVIGATPDDTAANFQTALESKLTTATQTVLSASSVYSAADSMLNGQGETIMRVDGPPYDSATAMIAATPDNTVTWYRGSDTTTPARQTVEGRVDESTNVDYGVQANEQGPLNLIRSLAALAVQDNPPSDANSNARYQAMATTQIKRLSSANDAQAGSLQVITLDLGIARTTVAAAGNRHKAYANQLQTLLAGIEQAPIEEVATQLLDLQTRLAASYQTTASIAQLSLVNYVR